MAAARASASSVVLCRRLSACGAAMSGRGSICDGILSILLDLGAMHALARRRCVFTLRPAEKHQRQAPPAAIQAPETLRAAAVLLLQRAGYVPHDRFTT